MIAPLVDPSIHHRPRGASDRIKMLRWRADMFFAECPPHDALVPHWKRAA